MTYQVNNKIKGQQIYWPFRVMGEHGASSHLAIRSWQRDQPPSLIF